MAMNVNNINQISPMKTMRWAKPKDETSEAPDAPGKEPEGGLSPIEKALQGTTKEEVTAWMDKWQAQHPLEINWNATVDPDGSAYSKAYFESMSTQLESIKVPAESIQENARAYANSVLDKLIEEYKKAHGIIL
jgi:hypothetical protein